MHLSEAITGQITAQEALDRTKADWKRIIDDYGQGRAAEAVPGVDRLQAAITTLRSTRWERPCRGRRGSRRSSPSCEGEAMDNMRSRAKYLFVVPGIVWVLCFTMFPLLYSLRLSFMHAHLGTPEHFIGFQNFVRAFSDYRFWNCRRRHGLLRGLRRDPDGAALGWGWRCSSTAPIRGQTRLPLPLHHADVHRPDRPGLPGADHLPRGGGRGEHRAAGAGHAATCRTGSPPSGWRALPSSWWTSGSGRPSASWCCWPGLQSLPEEVYEAAVLDTSSGWETFRYITLPLLSPVLFTVTILRMVETFKILDIPFSLTTGGPGTATQTYSFYVYLTGLRNFNQGYASALAYILLIIMMVIAPSSSGACGRITIEEPAIMYQPQESARWRNVLIWVVIILATAWASFRSTGPSSPPSSRPRSS